MPPLLPLLLAAQLATPALPLENPLTTPEPDSAPAASRILLAPSSSLLLPLPPSTGMRDPVSRMSPGPDAPERTPQLVEYSDGYFTRLTIHRWASYATIPLFVAQYVAGDQLIKKGDAAPGWARDLHGPLGGAIGALFAVNTVTGGLNLWESRKDPEGRKLRTAHSLLMLLADAGFVATGMLAEESEDDDGGGGFHDNTTHRNVAIASMGTALVSYLMMLPPFRRD